MSFFGKGRVLAAELPQHVGKEVRLVGWLHHLRDKGKIAFLIVRDRTGLAQGVVLDPSKVSVSGLQRESIVEVIGRVKEEPQAKAGVEVEVLAVKPLVEPKDELPFEINRSLEKLNLKIDTVLDHRAFCLRNQEIGAAFPVQAEICRAFQDTMRNEGFLEVHTSKIIKAGTEGGTALFPVTYFEDSAFLAQSPQFYKQMLVGAGFERVFELGFVYRAEDHATSRHINEYLSLDFEMGFIDSFREPMEVEKRFLVQMVEGLDKNCRQQLDILKARLPQVGDIPEVRFKDALQILKRDYNRDIDGMTDLDPQAERELCDYAMKKSESEFIFVTHFPAEARPFYTMPDPDDPGYTLGFDLLFRGLEVTTGSQRIHDFDMLVDNMRKWGLNPDEFGFYLEIFKYSMPPHGGLAIGTERLTQQILGLENVRQASFFPRDRYRLAP